MKLEKQAELYRVKAARIEMEIQLQAFENKILQIKENIILQDKKIIELEQLSQGNSHGRC